MAHSSQQVMAEVQRIAKEELQLDRTIQASDELIQDLQLDSLALTILAVGLEDRFRIKLTEEDSAQVTTVADLVSLVASRAGEAHR